MKCEKQKQINDKETTRSFAILKDDQQTCIGLNPQGPQENRNMYVVKERQKYGKQYSS